MIIDKLMYIKFKYILFKLKKFEEFNVILRNHKFLKNKIFKYNLI